MNEELTEIVFGRSPSLRVFLSSAMDDLLRADRSEVARVVGSMSFAEPWWWEENAIAGPYSPTAEYRNRAATCDALVLLLADRISDATREEYEIAKAAGAPCFIFVRQDVTLQSAVVDFVAAERSHAVYAPYATPDDLGRRVRLALTECATRTWRYGMALGFFASEAGGPHTVVSALMGTRIRSSVPPPGVPNEALPSEIGDLVRTVSSLGDEDRFVAVDWLAATAASVGAAWLGRVIAERLVPSVDVERLSEEDCLWLHNIEGLAWSAALESGKAESSFERFRLAALDAGRDFAQATALQNLGTLWLSRGDHDKAMDLFEDALRIGGESLPAYTAVQLRLSMVNATMADGRMQEAWQLIERLEDEDRTNDAHLRAAIRGTRAILLAEQGSFQQAHELHRKVLRSARRRQHAADELRAVHNIGATYANSGEWRKALYWYRKGTELAEAIGATAQLGELSHSIATALVHDGNLEEAGVVLVTGIEQAEMVGAIASAARGKVDLGAIRASQHDWIAAADLLADAVGTLTQLGDMEWLARALGNLALVRSELSGSLDARPVVELAITAAPTDAQRDHLYEQAAHLYLSEPPAVSHALMNIDGFLNIREGVLNASEYAWECALAADRLRMLGHPSEALDLYDRGLAALAPVDSSMRFDILHDRSLALVDTEQLERAHVDLEECLSMAARLQDGELQQRAHSNLAEVLRRLADLEQARTHGERAVELASSLADPELLADAYGNLGTVLVDVGDSATALQAWGKAAALAEEVDSDPLRRRAAGGLGNALWIEERWDEAANQYDHALALTPDALVLERIDTLVGFLASRVHADSAPPPQQDVQSIVDLSQAHGFTSQGAAALGRLARATTAYDFDGAAALYAGAVLLAVAPVPPAGFEEAVVFEGLAITLRVMDLHCEIDGFDAHLLRQLVRDQLTQTYGLAGDPLDQVWAALDEAASSL